MAKINQQAKQAQQPGELPAQKPAQKPAPKQVYHASWAPADPRDRLYDDKATAGQKTGSLLRIIGAFHPVLNLGVLLYDGARAYRRLFGFSAAALLLAALLLTAG